MSDSDRRRLPLWLMARAFGRTRASVLARVLLVAGVVAALIPLVPTTSYTVSIPGTLHAVMQVGGPTGPARPSAPSGPAGAGTSSAPPGSAASGQPSVVRAALPFAATHLGFQWHGAPHEPDAPEVRTSTDGRQWSPWARVKVLEDLSEPAAGDWWSELVGGRGARYVEVQDPLGRAVSMTDINVEDGPRRTVVLQRHDGTPGAAEAATPGPPIVSRAEWGADESIRKPGRTFSRVQKLFVHHTADPYDQSDPKGAMRAIYSYHVQSRGWDDIGYNYLIDSQGTVYEGRWARDYVSGEVHSGEDRNGRGVVGAQVDGFNTGSAGVAMMGNFDSSPPTPQAMDSLESILAWKADRYGLDPLGVSPYVNPSSGTTATFANIAGHRDADATACPGQYLYNLLPNVRSRVEERIRASSAGSPPSMPTGTQLVPGGATQDTTPSLSGAVSRSAVKVDLVFEGSSPLSRRVLTVTPRTGSFLVGDDLYGGTGLAEDKYSVRAVAYDAQGRASDAAPVADDYIVSLAGLPKGYWVMGRDGGVFAYGAARFYGSTGDRRLNAPAVGFDAAPRGDGYWFVASDGGIFAFGGAGFFGSTGGTRLNRPVVGMAATRDGNGYWLVASDGGIFSFGNAPFRGSTGNIRLNRPIVGMAATPSGNGYWLVASDGGIFAFGDAAFKGSTGNIRLSQPIVGMAATPSGNGYWLVASDGGVFAFGDARFWGSFPSNSVTQTAVGIKSGGGGYYLLAQDGTVRSYGPAPLFGNPAALGVTARSMAIYEGS